MRIGMDSDKVADRYVIVSEESPGKVRIETQIHRRRAAKTFSPLALEWEQAKPAHPNQEQL